MDLMTKPVVIAQFQKIHPQIYRALVYFEVIQKCEDTTQTLTTEWSEKYKSWADRQLQDNQQLALEANVRFFIKCRYALAELEGLGKSRSHGTKTTVILEYARLGISVE